MNVDAAKDFIRSHHRAVLVTRRGDGRPQTSPVLAGVDGQGRVVISTRQTAMKTKNLERDAHASLCVLSDGFSGPWTQVDGTVEIVRLPAAMDLLVDYYRRVSGEHDDWEDYRAAMQREGRVVLQLTVESAGPDRQG